ncbi:hypothetical protein LZD49_13100 [Dyadobacter sp. CY261]|uniref:hypothetical protein n=1 Tax=Dyadobacter sp. CY261 TaxID=2907203 RepID=UPI001F1AC5C9|nr:hypothetical protein [Dyadobacter sp. CY261]MCF0071412.1 hypothetical protein [Dyadobacter sp. CY261]
MKRLIENLHSRDFPFRFCDLGKDRLISVLRALIMHRVIHIHVSNPAYQLIFAAFCRLTFKTLLITYHGKWGRYDPLNNAIVKLSAHLAHAAIVQDRESLQQALRLNPRSQQISTYICGGKIERLTATLDHEINERCKHYAATFCTNAWDVVFDKNGKETYGISELIERFTDIQSINYSYPIPPVTTVRTLSKTCRTFPATHFLSVVYMISGASFLFQMHSSGTRPPMVFLCLSMKHRHLEYPFWHPRP